MAEDGENGEGEMPQMQAKRKTKRKHDELATDDDSQRRIVAAVVRVVDGMTAADGAVVAVVVDDAPVGTDNLLFEKMNCTAHHLASWT